MERAVGADGAWLDVAVYCRRAAHGAPESKLTLRARVYDSTKVVTFLK
jgi:hypothetical protein